jgi:hypothetical protein
LGGSWSARRGRESESHVVAQLKELPFVIVTNPAQAVCLINGGRCRNCQEAARRELSEREVESEQNADSRRQCSASHAGVTVGWFKAVVPPKRRCAVLAPDDLLLPRAEQWTRLQTGGYLKHSGTLFAPSKRDRIENSTEDDERDRTV